MRFTITRLVLAAITSVALLVPATASAHDGGNIQHKNKYLRAKVIKLHGERAPGRDIVRYGVKKDSDRWDAKWHNAVDRYFATLRRMLMPRPAAQYVKAGRPYVPPAQTATVRAPAGGTLGAIRQCESGGNYSTNTGNGYYGAYQFDMQTWQSVGGSGNPAAASPAEQDKRAAMLYAQRGASPWPVCGR